MTKDARRPHIHVSIIHSQLLESYWTRIATYAKRKSNKQITNKTLINVEAINDHRVRFKNNWMVHVVDLELHELKTSQTFVTKML